LYDGGGADVYDSLRGCGSGRLSGNAHLAGHINHERARFKSQKIKFSVFSFQFSAEEREAENEITVVSGFARAEN
jgi:hypothetical protein